MVLVDTSHLSMRNLYIAISQARPRKVDGQYVTQGYIAMYYHLMLQSLRHITTKFGDYGDIVLALDNKNNWRKEFFSGYKSHRKKDRDKSEVNFEEFFEKNEEFISVIDNCFPYKVIRVERAEADDIIGVLAEKYSGVSEVIVVSSDKDFKQVLEYGAELYDPIKKQFIKMSPEELKEWKMVHILCGDESDGIPHIKRGTQFTDKFISYLKGKEIHITDPQEFNELSISKKLYDEFGIYKVNKKGEVQDEKDIFKATPFGEVTAKKFLVNLKENLKENKLYLQNFHRNMKLVLFSEIPEDIREDIIKTYNEIEFKYDPNCIMEFLTKHSLQQQMMNITDFYVEAKKMENRNSGLEEWV